MMQVDFDFCVPADHPSLPGHFPGHPVVPGVLLLEHVMQPVQRATGRRVEALRQVKFTTPLRPEERAFASCVIDDPLVAFRVVAERAGAAVPIASGAVSLQAGEGQPT
jgi:3-hydroxymyristoyl/3-hydroxydecanoyl-(acyl carrier protein) dehydratase